MKQTRMVLLGAMLAIVPACGRSDRGTEGPAGPQATPEAMPESVLIPGGDVTLGTRIGSQRASVSVGTMHVSRTAITVGQWKACMATGACTEPVYKGGACTPTDSEDPAVDGPTLGRGDDNVPITCTSLAQANDQYCAFAHHGHVPTVEEMLLAIRGPTVRRFAWGDQRAGCDFRWRLTFAHDATGACCGHDCTDPAARRLGLHPAGNSPYGVSDVLSTHAELVASSAASPIAACRGEVGCVLTGMEPGAIDWILPLGAYEEPSGEKVTPYAAGFRCAWTGEVTP